MNRIATERLELRPFAAQDFERFVTTMLTDPRVVEFYFSYKVLTDFNEIRDKARKDFWDYFESSRKQHGLETWATRIEKAMQPK